MFNKTRDFMKQRKQYKSARIASIGVIFMGSITAKHLLFTATAASCLGGCSHLPPKIKKLTPDINIPELFASEKSPDVYVCDEVCALIQNNTMLQKFLKDDNPKTYHATTFKERQKHYFSFFPDVKPNDYVFQLAKAESALNPSAKAKTSSAKGLYQITNKTWASLVKRYGNKYGVTLKDRNNLNAQHKMILALTKENERIVTAKTGLKRLTNADKYLAHFLGPRHAIKFITLIRKGKGYYNAASIMPQAARSNYRIFHKGKTPRSVTQVYNIIKSKIS